MCVIASTSTSFVHALSFQYFVTVKKPNAVSNLCGCATVLCAYPKLLHLLETRMMALANLSARVALGSISSSPMHN